jgi:para-nitrobenzyl esterase
MYRFDWPELSDSDGFGSAHAVEIPYVFDTIGRPGLPPQLWPSPSRAVADSTHRVWVDFITSGDPGWAPYDLTHRTTGLLTETVAAVGDPAGDERALWDGVR